MKITNALDLWPNDRVILINKSNHPYFSIWSLKAEILWEMVLSYWAKTIYACYNVHLLDLWLTYLKQDGVSFSQHPMKFEDCGWDEEQFNEQKLFFRKWNSSFTRTDSLTIELTNCLTYQPTGWFQLTQDNFLLWEYKTVWGFFLK